MSSIRINPNLYTEKPTDSRLEKEMAVYDLLDKLGIAYQRLDHGAAGQLEYCDEVGEILGVAICKNLFLCNRQKTDFYLLMMPGSKEFHTKDLSKQINRSRLSFADRQYMEDFLQITPGSVSVMGLMNDTENRVQLLIDRDVTASPFVGCHPCINTSSLKIATADLLQKFLPSVQHEPIFVSL